MSEHKLVPVEDLINQWDEEMPLMTMDTILRQMLSHVQEGKAERAKFMRRIDDLTISVTEVRSRLKRLQQGGAEDVNL